jgi:hypothetical protein
MTERICATLFVPGTPAGPTEWARAIADAGLPFMPKTEWVANPRDGSFGHAFSFGTASAAEQRTIDAAAGAMILYLPVELHTERARIAGLAEALASRGALAVRIEESKLGYPIHRWTELVGGTDPWSLYRAVVVVLEDKDGGGAGTCGMQVFSLPDAYVASAFAHDRESVNALLGQFNIFQLVDDPVLRSGETFSISEDASKHVIHRWPDARYPRGHSCHNPFGVWRLRLGGSTEKLAKLTPVFVPALVAMLLAAENKAGRALTREQVEAMRDESTCIAMTPRNAQQMERKRGYADLEPALAWEQWQIARIAE